MSIGGIGGISLGGSIKTLGDGIQSRAGAEGNIGVGVGISIGSIEESGVSISRPLGDNSLGHGVKSLSDGVKTSAGSKGDTVHIGVGSIGVGVGTIGSISSIGQTSIAISSVEESRVSLSLSRPLAIVSMVSISVVGDISLGDWVKALGDGVQSGAGSKWNVSIGVGITKATIVSISVSLSGSKSSNTSQNNKFHHDSA